jgi:hypothetical protein
MFLDILPRAALAGGRQSAPAEPVPPIAVEIVAGAAGVAVNVAEVGDNG